jgi:hypothetical protein
VGGVAEHLWWRNTCELRYTGYDIEILPCQTYPRDNLELNRPAHRSNFPVFIVLDGSVNKTNILAFFGRGNDLRGIFVAPCDFFFWISI